MHTIADEPAIAVGLTEAVERVPLLVEGACALGAARLPPGAYALQAAAGGVELLDSQGVCISRSESIRLVPAAAGGCSFTLPENSIGRDFHWQRSSRQTFRGELSARCFAPGQLTLVNRIGLEDYLEAVICSEMRPRAHPEFLKAHCVISRSWLLAQRQARRSAADRSGAWTDTAAHAHFDVCNDDHCQRYHGIGAVNEAAGEALGATRGEVLQVAGAVCDTRFSKCCGGITERFSTCWQDVDYDYLQPRADCAPQAAGCRPRADSDAAARSFILQRPECFCNVTDRALLETILPDFDFETDNFFRWQTAYAQEELSGIVAQKSGIDFGRILRLEPLRRGASGRIFSLRIVGEKHTQVIGKELVVRRTLSPSHLYSSAFVIETRGAGAVPERFVLRGAGWGHGVGLCQIGAAAMAGGGYDYRQILEHYFQVAELRKLY